MCTENNLSPTLNQRLMTYEELVEENNSLSSANSRLRHLLEDSKKATEEANMRYSHLAEHYDKFTRTQVLNDEKKPTTITITVTI